MSAKKQQFCRRYNRVAWSDVDAVTGYRFFTRLRCKQWCCDVCAEQNSRMWRAHLLDNVTRMTDESSRWSFVTITSPADIRSPHASYHSVNNAWRNLTQLWRKLHRAYGGLPLEYARTLESHKSGAIHCHAIVMHSLPLDNFVNINHSKRYKKNKKNFFDKPTFGGRKTWRIKDIARRFGAGYQADCTTIQSDNVGIVVSYITKYITKSVQSELDLPTGARRILTSRGFGKFADIESDLAWYTDESLHWTDFQRLALEHQVMKDLQTNDVITLDIFENGLSYPPLCEKI